LPYYPELNLIFIHIPKPAGGAIEELLRPYRAPGNKTLLRRFLRYLPVRQDPMRAYIPGHSTTAWHRRTLGADTYGNATSFAVVRNSYERLVSEYENVRQNPKHHRHEKARRLDFNSYLRSNTRRLSQMSFIEAPDGSGVMVDRIIRFEALHDDLNGLLSEVRANVALPTGGRLNSSEKKPLDHYLTEETVQIINRACASDFHSLGYSML
jgi:hypothetical protein